MKKLLIVLIIIFTYSCGSTMNCEEKCGPDPEIPITVS